MVFKGCVNILDEDQPQVAFTAGMPTDLDMIEAELIWSMRLSLKLTATTATNINPPL
jgi:hypothetical protein